MAAKMRLAETVGMALNTLRANRLRSLLTMLGIVIGILTEAITGSGIAHQIGLGALVDGYAACRTQFLPFCF